MFILSLQTLLLASFMVAEIACSLLIYFRTAPHSLPLPRSLHLGPCKCSIIEQVRLVSGRQRKSDLLGYSLATVGGSLWQPPFSPQSLNSQRHTNTHTYRVLTPLSSLFLFVARPVSFHTQWECKAKMYIHV